MKIKFVGPYEVGLLEQDRTVEPGEVIDVPDPERYLGQKGVWERADDEDSDKTDGGE